MAVSFKPFRLLAWVVGGLVGTALLIAGLAGGLLYGANTDTGRGFIASAVASLTGGQVRIAGLAGRFPEDLQIARIELADAGGVWLGIDDLALAWSPRRLLSGAFLVRTLSAARIAVARLPAAGGGSSGTSFAMPLRIDVESLHVGRIDIAEPVAGVAGAFAADGRARLAALDRAQGTLSMRRLDQPGEYRLDAHQDAAGLHARLIAHEPGNGFLAFLAGLPELGPVTLDAAADGPRDAMASRIVLDAGKLHAEANGVVNIDRPSGEMVLTLADLAPAAALAGLDLRASTRLTIRADLQGGITHLQADGALALTAGPGPLPALLGPGATLHLAADFQGADIAVTALSLDGAAASATARGTLKGNDFDLDWSLALPDLPVLLPSLGGEVQAKGHVAGKLTDFAASADIAGTATPPGMRGGRLTVHVDAQGLPSDPVAKITAAGELAGATLDLAMNASRQPDGTLHATIARAAWNSATAQGDLTLPPGATVPLGRLDLKFDRLADLAPRLGRPVSGALTATLDSTPQRAMLTLEARNAGIAGTASAGVARLTATIPDPAHPVAEIRLTAEALRLNAIADPIRLTTEARLDIPARQATIATLVAGWNREQIRLLNPLRISFADAVRLDRLRIGLRQAVLEASGQVSPTLDLTASLRGVTPDLAALFVPGLDADGSLRADARLTGPPARPSGTLRVEATGLRPRGGAARGLPPAQIMATANLADGRARIDARLTAGSASLTVNGIAPLAGGPIDLRADGTAKLGLLQPLISAGGRRVGGALTLHANVRGTRTDPRIDGLLSLANGSIQDYTTGLHLTAITATLHGDGAMLRIDRFTGRAGPNQGSIDLAGSLGILAPGMPVDLTLTARNARPVSNDVLTATLDADLALRGQASPGPGSGNDLTLSGTVKLLRADIRIPERLPVSIPVLHVIRPGARAAPPPPPGPDIRLNLTLNAPQQIFVRGRGLDAELGGTVHLGGTLSNPQPDGRFQLRRGEFSLAGQTITFIRGEIGFDGGSLTDPSLNFLASRSGTGVTANLAITGSARSPKITLSSSPPLPQDEVLSQLLLGRGAATLQPLELAQVAAALASLTGVTSGIGDPLNTVRTELGLDRLSIGSNGGGSSLDAGRYVSPGIYIGARQSLSGSGTQSVVQIDITKGLKLEGTVGTGTASATGTQSSQGTGVAVIYQKDY